MNIFALVGLLVSSGVLVGVGEGIWAQNAVSMDGSLVFVA